jgi:nitroimidazol reductase NimA-like FMN-containing flavoprotein (pyridoxamine 5'-phosphate oxidase superfamily)
MRRAERQITDLDAIRAILSEARNCTLSLIDREEPYGVVLSYGYRLDPCGRLSLYFHSAPEGRKIDIVRQNPRAAFSLFYFDTLITGPMSCDYTAHYRSVAGVGQVHFVEGDGPRAEALDLLMQNHGAPTPGNYTPGMLKRVTLLRLDAEHYTAKQNG